MKWFNFYGLIFIAVIMIPNIIFAMKHKDGFVNKYKNKAVETLEQVGRIGCFVFIFLNIKPAVLGYWFKGGWVAYLVSGAVLTVAYVLGWIVFRNESSVRKSMYLSIVPSVLFIICGVFTLNIPLMVSSLIFTPCHIIISYKNAV